MFLVCFGIWLVRNFSSGHEQFNCAPLLQRNSSALRLHREISTLCIHRQWEHPTFRVIHCNFAAPKAKQQADGKPTTHSLSLRLPFRWLCSFFCFLRSLKGDDHQMEMPNRLHWFPVQKHVCEIEGKKVLTLMTLDVNQKLIRIRSFVSLQCTHKFWFLQCTHECQMQFVCWHCKTNN